jgi:predicted deacylase
MTEQILRHLAGPFVQADIPYHDIGGEGAPRVALVGGLQGTDVNAVFVLGRLASYLGAVTREEQRGRLMGRVVIVPAVNVPALHAGCGAWPLDNTDIDRMFPGNEQGETTQRIARALLERTKGAYYRVQLGNGPPHLEETPQVRLVEPHDDERSTACQFGLPVTELAPDTDHGSTLYAAWQPWGGERFVLRAGLAGSFGLRHCERLFRALVAFLHRTGVLQEVTLADEDEDLHYFGAEDGLSVPAQRAGLFVSALEVGRWLQAGQALGQIFDGFTGELRAEVRTPVSGLLTGLRSHPLVFEGDLLARVCRRRPG